MSAYTYGDPTEFANEGGALHPERDNCDLTASEVGAVLGVGYVTRNQLLERKMSGVEPKLHPKVEEMMQRGRDLEPQALEDLDRRFGRTHREGNFWKRSVTAAIGDTLMLGATPDGTWTVDGKEENIEIKCPMVPRPLTMEDDTKWWNYYVQCQVQLFCSRRDTCTLYSYHPEVHQPGCLWRISWNPEFWERYVLPELFEFKCRVRKSRESGQLLQYKRRADGWLDEFYHTWGRQVRRLEKERGKALL